MLEGILEGYYVQQCSTTNAWFRSLDVVLSRLVKMSGDLIIT